MPLQPTRNRVAPLMAGHGGERPIRAFRSRRYAIAVG
jgi:hypothetical protein